MSGGGAARRSAAPEIAMIFQDALSALNPVFTVGSSSARCSASTAGMSERDAKTSARSS